VYERLIDKHLAVRESGMPHHLPFLPVARDRRPPALRCGAPFRGAPGDRAQWRRLQKNLSGFDARSCYWPAGARSPAEGARLYQNAAKRRQEYG
jgi:hypothetical protein